MGSQVCVGGLGVISVVGNTNIVGQEACLALVKSKIRGMGGLVLKLCENGEWIHGAVLPFFDRYDKNLDHFPRFLLKASVLVQSQKAVDELLVVCKSLQPPVIDLFL